MSPSERNEQAALIEKLLKEKRTQRARAISGQHCDTEYQTGAEVCIGVRDTSIDCHEAIFGRYYDQCEVEIDYYAETNYQGGAYLEADIECEATLSTSGRNTFLSTTDTDSDSKSIDLYANDSETGSIDLSFSLSSFAEITRARVESASCRVRDITLY
jgi:hypothetical protein